ncbi:MAG: DNA polymerase III subunit delta [Pseudomonadota bacterium]
MQIRAEDFSSHLASQLLPVYLISGDETLLVEECCDAIIAQARDAGFTERSIHHVESGFKWHELSQDAASMSLFAERKILDVRVPAKKFDKQASEALRAWVDQVSAQTQIDNILLLRTSRLEPRQRSSAWFKALDAVAGITLIWPMSVAQLPRWLKQRVRSRQLQLDADAITYLAERVEGNLLAAAQEIDKLALMGLPQPVSVEALVACLEDTSRFNSFDLLDAVMAGDPARTARILAALREEGVALFAILGALTSQLRRMDNPRGLPPARQKLLQQFARRIRDGGAVLAECAIIDQQGKGQLPGDAWLSLQRLLLRLARLSSLSLPSQDQRLLIK